MLHTRLVRLVCWRVAVLSSPPVNEPVTHIQRRKTLTSWFPGPVWARSDPGGGSSGEGSSGGGSSGGSSGPQRALFFPQIITR